MMPVSKTVSACLPARHTRLAALLLAATLAGCATPGTRSAQDEGAAHQAVSEAVSRNDCAAARDAVVAMAQAFPDARRLPDARLEAAYACLRSGDAPSAEALSSGFLDSHPGHPSTDYGRYLHGLAAYAAWKRLPPTAPVEVREGHLREAFGRFRTLMLEHPDTQYGEDVRPLLMDLREGLARIELEAIRRDLDAGRHDSVIPRARYVLSHYGNTESAPYALAALVSAHRARNEDQVARTNLMRLESDWPDHPVLQTLQ
ncbi:MAG: outer membrane protein assembly factor BamD [Thioalkalivibrio sp.]